MLSFKPVLAAAVIALAVPLATTSPSSAQTKAQYSGGGGHVGGGGGHMGHGGGGGHMGMRPGGGGGGNWAGGGGRHWAGGGGWHGGHWHGGGHRWGGGYYGGGGFFPGFVVGSAIGSAFASPYYYDDYGYYDDGPVAEVVPSNAGDIAYCQQRFKSYDVSSGTYLGYDGLRHPCP